MLTFTEGDRCLSCGDLKAVKYSVACHDCFQYAKKLDDRAGTKHLAYVAKRDMPEFKQEWYNERLTFIAACNVQRLAELKNNTYSPHIDNYPPHMYPTIDAPAIQSHFSELSYFDPVIPSKFRSIFDNDVLDQRCKAEARIKEIEANMADMERKSQMGLRCMVHDEIYVDVPKGESLEDMPDAEPIKPITRKMWIDAEMKPRGYSMGVMAPERKPCSICGKVDGDYQVHIHIGPRTTVSGRFSEEKPNTQELGNTGDLVEGKATYKLLARNVKLIDYNFAALERKIAERTYGPNPCGEIILGYGDCLPPPRKGRFDTPGRNWLPYNNCAGGRLDECAPRASKNWLKTETTDFVHPRTAAYIKAHPKVFVDDMSEPP